MHCFQVYLPSEVSYIGFGVFSMHSPVVLVFSCFFFFGTFLFFLFRRKHSDMSNVHVTDFSKSIEDTL